MASKQQQSGMLGVYLTAAELTARGFIVSVTSRNAIGADLLVTTALCKTTWSIQVKTNGRRARFWLLNSHAKEMAYSSHIYVFVNLKGNERPDYYVVPSEIVAAKVWVDKHEKGDFHSFPPEWGDIEPYLGGWDKVLGDPGPQPEPQPEPPEVPEG